VTGWPVTTMVRGRIVVQDGALAAAGGPTGVHVARGRSAYAVPAGAGSVI
jgi:dihydropyrimidinase